MEDQVKQAPISAEAVARSLLAEVPLGPALRMIDYMRDRLWHDMIPRVWDPSAPIGKQLIAAAKTEARLVAIEVELALQDAAARQVQSINPAPDSLSSQPAGSAADTQQLVTLGQVRELLQQQRQQLLQELRQAGAV